MARQHGQLQSCLGERKKGLSRHELVSSFHAQKKKCVGPGSDAEPDALLPHLAETMGDGAAGPVAVAHHPGALFGEGLKQCKSLLASVVQVLQLWEKLAITHPKHKQV